MRNPKEYLSDLDVGNEITPSCIDKILKAMDEQAQEVWNEACAQTKKHIDKLISEDAVDNFYQQPDFNTFKFNIHNET